MNPNDPIISMLWLAVPLLAIFGIGSVLATTFFTVGGKTAAILETFGKPHINAKMPGLRVKLPYPITQVVAYMDLRQREIKANISVKTSDDAFVTLPVKVLFRASDQPDGAVLAHYQLENPEEQISSYILNNVRHTASGMSMADLYANRDQLEQQVAVALSARFAQFGYIIENVLVDQPQPSKDVEDAFNKVIASKRLKDAATNEADAIRIKLVGAAEAEKQSKKLQGEGMADMRKAVAAGIEEAMSTMQKAGLSPQEAMIMMNETNRLDTISNAAAHGNMVIVDTKADPAFNQTFTAVKAATHAKHSMIAA